MSGFGCEESDYAGCRRRLFFESVRLAKTLSVSTLILVAVPLGTMALTISPEPTEDELV